MDYNEFWQIVRLIDYKPGWHIIAGLDCEGGGRRPFIQIRVEDWTEAARDAFGGPDREWSGAKHYGSLFMCRQEVVGLVFGAIRAAEEHEMREWFKYKQRAIYCPHLDPDVLADVATLRNMSLRDNPMTMVEK